MIKPLLQAKVEIMIIKAIITVPMFPKIFCEATTATLSDSAVAMSCKGTTAKYITLAKI